MAKTELDKILNRKLDLAFIAVYHRLTVGEHAEYRVEIQNVDAVESKNFTTIGTLYTKVRLVHYDTRNSPDYPRYLTDWATGKTIKEALASLNSTITLEVQRISEQLRLEQQEELLLQQ